MPDNVYVVRAFTADGKNGNPAGVMLDADGLDEQSMLAIAARMGLSETAFVSKSDRATYRVRFFTSTVEEPLCGHATVATWSLLSTLGRVDVGMYTQETAAGLLKVSIQNDGLVFMEQTKAQFFDEIAPGDVGNLLGITNDYFHAVLRPQMVSTGIKDLLIPVADKSLLSKLRPDLPAIAAFSKRRAISAFHVFALLADRQSLAACRNFAPADGILEECATGTSNGALLCYLKRYNVLPSRELYRIEQGEAMGKLSYVYGRFDKHTVWIGGHAAIEQNMIV